MDSNKQYIVLEPQVDFQHLEYVIVLRYKPEPLAVEGRDKERTGTDFVPLESARPSPVVPEIASSLFNSQTEETEEPAEAEEATPTPEPTPSPTPTEAPTATPAPTPYATSLEYQVVVPRGEPTATPTATIEPTPTPYYTPDPDNMIFEED